MANPDQPQTDEFTKVTAAFLRWFAIQPGARLSEKVTLADLRFRDAGRGLVANTDIKAGETLFVVPLDLEMNIKDTTMSEDLQVKLDDLGPQYSLITAIIHELMHLDESPWAPFLRTLPREHHCLALWTAEENEQLRGSAACSAGRKRNVMGRLWNGIVQALFLEPIAFPTPSWFSATQRKIFLMDLVIWAALVVGLYEVGMFLPRGDSLASIIHGRRILLGAPQTSLALRDFAERFRGWKVQTPLLLPMVGMLNWTQQGNTNLVSGYSDYSLKATEPIKAEQELLVKPWESLRHLSKAEMLTRFGYVEESARDRVEVPVNLIVNMAMSSGIEEEDAIAAVLRTVDERDIYLHPPSPFPALPRPISRNFVTLLTHLTCLQRGRRPPPQNTPPKFTIHEAQLLQSIIISSLGQYRTSIAQDEELLLTVPPGASPRDRRTRMAIQIRKGEKEILTSHLGCLTKFIHRETDRLRQSIPILVPDKLTLEQVLPLPPSPPSPGSLLHLIDSLSSPAIKAAAPTGSPQPADAFPPFAQPPPAQPLEPVQLSTSVDPSGRSTAPSSAAAVQDQPSSSPMLAQSLDGSCDSRSPSDYALSRPVSWERLKKGED